MPAIRTFLVTNDFSNKQVAYFVTLGEDKAEKPLKNMKKTVTPKSVFGELAITKALENQDETEKQVIDWCKQIAKS